MKWTKLAMPLAQAGLSLAALPASILGGLAPVQLDKPYKMRPRGPV